MAYDIEETLDIEGHDVVRVSYPISSYVADKGFNDYIVRILDKDNFDCIFTMNYIPALAKISFLRKIKYIAWISDSPNYTTYSEMIHSPYNYIFHFDKKEVENLRSTGAKNIFHMPLAVNTKRVTKQIETSKTQKNKYKADVSFLGTGGCQFLSADRFLLYKACCHCRFQESVHCHPLCRLRLPYRYSDLRILRWHIRLHTGYGIIDQWRRFHASIGFGTDVYRWRRKECHVPVAYLAARCHGRSYSCQCLDPCGYDGSCRRLSGSAYVPAFHCLCTGHLTYDCLGRCFHRLLCSKRGLRTIGYQTCAGLLDHFTDWFYDGSTGRLYFYGPAPRRTGIYGFHVPPLHTRHVQGITLLGCRQHYPCSTFQRNVSHGRTTQIHAYYSLDIPDCLSRHCRYSSVLRFLLKR